MALNKIVKTDKIEIVGDFKQLQIRTATIIEENGVELSRSYDRRVIEPGTDVSTEDAEIQAVAAAVHTQPIIDAYNTYLQTTQV